MTGPFVSGVLIGLLLYPAGVLGLVIVLKILSRIRFGGRRQKIESVADSYGNRYDLPKSDIEPVAQLDVSLDDPSSLDVNLLRQAISDAGYTLHPFPRIPDGSWSREYWGVYRRQPHWQGGEEDGGLA